MRAVVRLIACVGVALAVAGCDPTTERRYINEGAGVDLYTPDRAGQIELLNQYINFVCEQTGSSCQGNWSTFVQAGMNDIDARCDGFLTWLDGRRRDREPVLAEISAINTAVHSVMTVTGSNPKSLDIVTAAFGLASASYNNWNSRLLISVNQSTVQEIVYTSQGKFRAKIKSYPVPDQPTAIYLLRNYLRLCTPITIEASINTITMLVQRDAPPESMQSLVVTTTTPVSTTPVRPVVQVIHSTQPIVVTPPLKEFVTNAFGPIEPTISVTQGKALQTMLCVPATGNFGPEGSTDPTRIALHDFNMAYLYGSDPMPAVPDNIKDSKTRDDLFNTLQKFRSCTAAGFQNPYEVGIFSKFGFPTVRGQIAKALTTKAQQPVPAGLTTGGASVDPVLRNAITTLRRAFGTPGQPNLDPAFYDWISRSTDRN
jgi:hypothetical protein